MPAGAGLGQRRGRDHEAVGMGQALAQAPGHVARHVPAVDVGGGQVRQPVVEFVDLEGRGEAVQPAQAGQVGIGHAPLHHQHVRGEALDFDHAQRPRACRAIDGAGRAQRRERLQHPIVAAAVAIAGQRQHPRQRAPGQRIPGQLALLQLESTGHVQAQVGVVGGIARQRRQPALAQGIECRFRQRRRFGPVQQQRLGRADHQPPERAGAQAQIDIRAPVGECGGVESTELVEQVAPDQQAAAGDRRAVLGHP